MEESHTLVMNWRSAMLAIIMLCAMIPLGYLYSRKIERRAVAWLGALVMAAVVSGIPVVAGFAGAFDVWPGLTFLPVQMTLLLGPLVFFHARALMLGQPNGHYWWLLLPGAVYWIYQLWAFLFLGDHTAKWAFNEAVHYPYVLPAVFYAGLGLMAWALFAIWRMRTRYLAWLQDHYSDDDAFDPAWLMHLIAIGVPLVVVWALENFLGRIIGLNYAERFWAEFSVFVLLFFVSLEALARIQRPYPKMAEPRGPAATRSRDRSERDWSAEGLRLQAAVLENGWHLQPGLSLQELARRFGMNQAYVSRALNQGFRLSFSSFINGLRVEHAKVLLDEGRMSLLDVAMASGFGSKASFNRAFKLFSGLTPSAYRRAQTSQFP
ncbi:MAG: AraC family transcriptional regulator [Chromatiales bacterium]|nr:MAG: AraC family transcriptional regulator [Chromatiales bacterium]